MITIRDGKVTVNVKDQQAVYEDNSQAAAEHVELVMEHNDWLKRVLSKAREKKVILIEDARKGRDSRDVFVNGKYVGFCGLEDDFVKIQRCYECGRENYMMSVSEGVCCWCGWNPNGDER